MTGLYREQVEVGVAKPEVKIDNRYVSMDESNGKKQTGEKNHPNQNILI